MLTRQNYNQTISRFRFDRPVCLFVTTYHRYLLKRDYQEDTDNPYLGIPQKFLSGHRKLQLFCNIQNRISPEYLHSLERSNK